MTYRKTLLYFFLLICSTVMLSAPLQAQTILTFPRVVSDANLFTGFAVSNPTTTPVSVTFTAFQPDGTVLAGSGVRNPVTLSIPAGGQVSKIFPEVFGTASFNGWVQASSNTSGLTGFFLNGNSALTDLDGAASITPVAEQVLPMAVEDGTIRTEVTIVNISAEPASATVTLYASDGHAISTKDVSLAGRGLVRQTLTGLMGPGDYSAASHIKIKSTRPLIAHEVVADYMLSGSTVRRETIAMAGQTPVAGQTYVLPQFVSGGGWLSLVGLANAGGVGQDVTLTAYREDGSLWPASTNPRRVSLDANGGLRATVGELFGFTSTTQVSGWIEVKSSLGFLSAYIGYGNVSTPSFALVSASESSTASKFEVFSQVAEGGGYFTGLTVVNPGKTAASVEFYTMRADGSTVGRSVFTVEPNQRIARLFRELLPASLEQVGGWGYLRSSQPVIGAVLFGSTNGYALSNVPQQLPSGDYLPPALTTASVTGSVLSNGAAVDGVQITITGPVTATKISDGLGQYVFSQLPKGQYKIAATKAGASFSPAEITITISQDNVEKANFEAGGLSPAASPIASFVAPASTFAGTRTFSVRVLGNNFTPASVVKFNGQAVPTTYVSSTELQAVLPSIQLSVAGSRTIQVETPPPGGGTSTQLSFVINAAPQNPLIEGRMQVGSVPSGAAIDSKRNHALITNQSSDFVSVVDLKTLETLKTIKVGRSPADGIAIYPDKDIALVANPGDGNVSVIDLATNTETKKITVGTFPIGLAIDATAKKAFVANFSSGDVSIIDLDSLTETGKFTAGEGPSNIAINTKTHVGLVTNRSANTATVFNATTGQTQGSIFVGERPRGVAINPDTNQALIVNANANEVWIIDMATRNLVAKVGVGTFQHSGIRSLEFT